MKFFRLSKDKMNSSKSKTIAAFSLLTLLALPFYVSPSNTYAQAICPTDFNASLTPVTHVSSEPEQEERWTDINSTEHNFSVTIPETHRTVNFTVTTDLEIGMFTKIYANLLSMIPAFATAQDKDAEAFLGNPSENYTDWKRFYCLHGLDDKEKGSLTVGMSGSFYDEKEERERYVCGPFELPPPGETLCSHHETKRYTHSESQDNTQDIVVPYYSGPNEILTKVANIVNEQYCDSKATVSDCINDNYICDTSKFVPKSGEIAAKNKDGICTLKPELANSTKFNLPYARMIDVLCTDTIGKTGEYRVETDKLNSNICLYNPGSYSMGPPNPNALPRLVSASIGSGSGKNQIPFDTSLFIDRNESSNPDCLGDLETCQADGALRRIFNNKLLQYSKDELTAIDKISAKFGSDYSSSGGAKSMNDPWAFDYVEKLGGIDFLAEEARLFDPGLLPVGYASMSDKGNSAYLRMVNADNGALFINGEPVGVRPFYGGKENISVQHRPFISSQLYGNGYVTFTVVRESARGGRYVPYISVNGGNLREIPLGGNVTVQYPYAAYMNSRGDVFIALVSQGKYQYTMLNSRTNTFSGWVDLGPEFGIVTKFMIDQQDQIHVLALPPGDSSNELKYTKLDFRTAEAFPLSRRMAVKSVVFPRALNGWGSMPMGMQIDKKGYAHIVGSVSVQGPKYWFENDLYYTWMDTNGNQGPLEIAVKKDLDYSTGYLTGMSQTEPNDAVSHQLARMGTSISINDDNGTVYIAYINYMLSNSFGAAYQAAYAKRAAPGVWVQNKKLSDRLTYQFGEISNIYVDRYGNAGFTVWEKGSKFNTATRKFDGAGFKQCNYTGSENLFMMGRGLFENIGCAYNRDEIAYIVAPSNKTAGGKMVFKQGAEIQRLPAR